MKISNELLEQFMLKDELEIDTSERIGEGQHSDVYRGTLNNQSVACKKLVTPQTSYSDELKILLVLSDSTPKCNALIGFQGFTNIDGSEVLVFELANQGTLQDYIKSKKLDDSMSVSIVKTIAEALAFLQTKSIIHRDLKSDNVFLLSDRNGELHARLGDFGYAIDSKAEQKKIKGTIEYFAPELLLCLFAKMIDDSELKNELNLIFPPELRMSTFYTDIYALGCVIYEMLTGRKVDSFAKSPSVLIDITFKNKKTPTALIEISRNNVAKMLGTIQAKCCLFNATSRPRASEIVTDCIEIQAKLG